MLHNPFYLEVMDAYENGASVEELRELLGRGRAKKGMFEGDMINGELEVGQVSSQLSSITSAQQVVERIISEYNDLAAGNFQRF